MGRRSQCHAAHGFSPTAAQGDGEERVRLRRRRRRVRTGDAVEQVTPSRRLRVRLMEASQLQLSGSQALFY